jgi:hypothetical protein
MTQPSDTLGGNGWHGDAALSPRHRGLPLSGPTLTLTAELMAPELSTHLTSKPVGNSLMRISANCSQSSMEDEPAGLGDNTQSDVEAAIEMVQKVWHWKCAHCAHFAS